MYSKCIIATIAAFVVLFLADYLWFGVIFKDYMANAMPPAGNESIPLHALGELCFAGLLAWIFPMMSKGGSAVSEGLKFGFIMGLVYQLPNAIHMYASMGGSRRIPVFFIANGILMGILAGITIAMIYGKKSAPAAS